MPTDRQTDREPDRQTSETARRGKWSEVRRDVLVLPSGHFVLLRSDEDWFIPGQTEILVWSQTRHCLLFHVPLV